MRARWRQSAGVGAALLVLAWIALGVAGTALPASAQDTTFSVASVGDSITEADSEEDTNAECHGPNFRANCGYPRRLAGLSAHYNASSDGSGRHYVCSSQDCEFINWGVSGSRIHTSSGAEAMVTYIDDVLANRQWDVVIVMGGTNDIQATNTSLNTLITDLNIMAGKIIAAGADPVHSSVIRLHPDRKNPSTAEANNIDSFRGMVQNLAQNNRYFADPWFRMCPDSSSNEYHGHSKTNCFKHSTGSTGHYNESWLSADPVGHPDADGYDIIARAMYEELNKTSIPGTSSSLAPSGATACGNPSALTWHRESPQRATWYQVEVDSVAHAWDQVADLCSGSNCSFPAPGGSGTPGGHNWRVRGRNPRGWGSWASASYSVNGPSGPTLSSPIGDIGSTNPTYVWQPSSGATGYRLIVNGPSGTVVDQNFTTSICGGSCSTTPGGSLSPGDYSWSVQASNSCGTGQSNANFTLWPPVTPTLLAPKVETFATSPTFEWTDSGATSYRLLVDGGTAVDQTYNDSICSAGRCSAAGGPLSIGGHTWRITATNPVETNSTSLEAFDVVSCGNATEQVENVTYVSTATIRACSSVEIGNLGGGDVTVSGSGELLLHSASIEVANGFAIQTGGELTVIVEP